MVLKNEISDLKNNSIKIKILSQLYNAGKLQILMIKIIVKSIAVILYRTKKLVEGSFAYGIDILFSLMHFYSLFHYLGFIINIS